MRKADDVAGLLDLSLKDRDLGTVSGKRWTRIIYEDETLLEAALELARIQIAKEI